MHESPVNQEPQAYQRPIGSPIIRRQRVYGGDEAEERAEGRWLALKALHGIMQEVLAEHSTPTILDELDGTWESEQMADVGHSGSRSYANNSSKPEIVGQLPSAETGWPSDEYRLECSSDSESRRTRRPPIKRVNEPHSIPLVVQSTAGPREYECKTGRVERARLLDGIRRFSHKRVRQCHKNPIGSDPVQLIHRDDGSCCIVGLETCSSVHACPVCAAKICAGRADEVTTAATLWRAMQHETYLLTLTIRHSDGDDLKKLLQGLAKCWSLLWEGRKGITLKRQLGMSHYIRAFECTFADFPSNGWHPHLHALIFCNSQLVESERHQLQQAINSRWQGIVARVLGEQHRPSDERGTTLHISTDAGYIVKLGLEVASIVTKKAKGEHRTTWQIAEDAALGERRSQALWRQWDRCSMGRKQLTWSRGTKKLFRIVERTDEQLCLFTEEQLAQGPCYLIALYDAREWRQLAYQHRYWFSRVTCALQGDSPSTQVDRLPGEKLPIERAGPGFVPAIAFVPKPKRFQTAPSRPQRHDTPELLAAIRMREDKIAAA